jgi:predicted ATPase/DNA-binding CsgD family transcriptional regulator/tetratricopeptide (TPR) repeat protein
MPFSTFEGRQPEIAALADLVTRNRLVTATGPGGCGKTRLAEGVVARLGEPPGEVFATGLFWVPCANLTGPELLPAALADALRLATRFHLASLDEIARELGDRRLLLVLDDCDRVPAAVQALAAELMRRCGGVHLLATSRVRLGIDGEVSWRVPPMTVPDAVELFIARAGTAIIPPDGPQDPRRDRTTMPRPDLDRALVAEICRRLDGLPLAIELAAARTRVLNLPEIARGLDDHLTLLAGGSRFTPRRHRTIRACIDWSYEFLDEPARLLLRRLAVFSSGARLAEVEAVCAFDALASANLLDLLMTLVDHSLVVADQRSADSRFRLSDTVAAFARERLAESGEADEVRRRHGDTFLALVEARQEGLIVGDRQVLAEIYAAWDNLAAALTAGVAGVADSRPGAGRDEAIDRLLKLAVAVGCFGVRRGLLGPGLHWLRTVSRVTAGTTSALRVRLLVELATLEQYIGYADDARATAEAALALATELGDRAGRGRCLRVLATAQTHVLPRQALPMLTESSAIATVEGDPAALASAALTALWAHLSVNDFVGARTCVDELTGVASQVDELHAAFAEAATGLIAAAHGDFPAARAAAERVFADRGRGVVSAQTYGDIAAALAEAAAGRWDDAITRLDARAALLTAAGMRTLPAEPIARAAELRAYAGRCAEVETTWGAVGSEPGVVAPTPLLVARMLVARARARLATVAADTAPPGTPLPGTEFASAPEPVTRARAFDPGSPGSAAPAAWEARVGADLQEAYATAEANDDRYLLAGVAEVAGRLRRRTGDLAGAAARLQDALRLRSAARLWPEVSTSLEAIAVVESERKRHRRAVVLFSAASRLRDVLGCVRPPIYDLEVRQALDTCRDRMTTAAFETAAEVGAKLDGPSAVVFAGRARGPRGRPATGWAALTPTEREVARAVVRGLSNPEVGRTLSMSLSTVKTHLSRVFGKLGVTSRAELAALVVRADPGAGGPATGRSVERTSPSPDHRPRVTAALTPRP